MAEAWALLDESFGKSVVLISTGKVREFAIYLGDPGHDVLGE